MTHNISQTDPASMTTEDMIAELDGFVTLAEEVAARMSVLLAELRRRRRPHPFFNHPVLRFFEHIADNTLHPKAAIILGNRDMIKAVLPLPPREQVAVALGKVIPVASRNAAGEVVRDDMPILRMDPATIKRAFGPSGVREFDAQAELLRSEGKVERHGMITVLRDQMALKIGNQTIRPEELKGPLAALGYVLELRRTIGDVA